MAIKKSQTIVLQVFGDGTSLSFSVDLSTNPHWIVSPVSQAALTNWFGDKSTAALPVNVNPDGTGSDFASITATISGTVLTVTYPGPALPARTPDRVTIVLIW